MRIFLPVIVLISCLSGAAQTPAFTAADYARAEKFMGYNTTPLVFGNAVRPTFIGGTDQFWYRVTRPGGASFVLVNPDKGQAAPAFDHAKLAAALSTASNTTIEASRLPFQTIDFPADMNAVTFSADGKRWKCTLDS